MTMPFSSFSDEELATPIIGGPEWLVGALQFCAAPIVAVDESGRIAFMTRSFAVLAGVEDPDAVIDHPFDELVGARCAPRSALRGRRLASGARFAVDWSKAPQGCWIGVANPLRSATTTV